MAAEIFTDLLPTKYMKGAEIAGKINADNRDHGHFRQPLKQGSGDALWALSAIFLGEYSSDFNAQ